MTVTRRPSSTDPATSGVEAFIGGAPDARATATTGRGRPRTVNPDAEQLISVRVDSDLYRQAKLLAVRDGIIMKELLASALTREVTQRSDTVQVDSKKSRYLNSSATSSDVLTAGLWTARAGPRPHPPTALRTWGSHGC